MAVYFVYRSQYDTPALSQIKIFDNSSVLEWFRSIWKAVPLEESQNYSKELLGFQVYGLFFLFSKIHEYDIQPPNTPEELNEILRKHLYVEGKLLFQHNAIQVLTNDDELDMAYYILDDTYVQAHPNRVEFLLHEPFDLSTEFADNKYFPKEMSRKILPTGTKPGRLYCAFNSEYNSGGNLSHDLPNCWHIDNLRLPDLCGYLSNSTLADLAGDSPCPTELLTLRSQLPKPPGSINSKLKKIVSNLLPNAADNSQSLGAQGENEDMLVLTNALAECCKFAVCYLNHFASWHEAPGLGVTEKKLREIANVKDWKNDPSKSRMQISKHMAQISVHTNTEWTKDIYSRWIIFDDLWAGANDNMANSLLRYAGRWDVLSEGTMGVD